MRRIWKYPLEMKKSQTIELPEGAKILSCISQGDQVVIYADVDDNPELECPPVEFYIIGTGNPVVKSDGTNIPVDATFLGTVTTHDDCLVWHVFHDA